MEAIENLVDKKWKHAWENLRTELYYDKESFAVARAMEVFELYEKRRRAKEHD